MSEPLLKPQAAATAKPTTAAERVAPIARAVLRGAAKGLCCERGGFQAGELWLLDDDSQTLSLAARWARKGSVFAESSPTTTRPLAHAPADVAALAGGAVVLEDPADAAGWDLHVAKPGAAVGLPVSSDKTIHGVLWLLAESPMSIADEAVELAEIVAGRLALEFERVADSSDRTENAGVRLKNIAEGAEGPASAITADGDSADSNQPLQSAVAPPVEAAAWTAPHAEGASAAACWELPKGRMLAIAAAAIDSPDSSCESQRAAVVWLMEEARQIGPRAGDAGLLLTLLNRRLLDSPMAGEGLAVAAALLDAPEDAEAGLGGVGTWAFAGPTVAISVRAAMTETHSGDLVPLGWTEYESAYAPRPFELAVRQRLVLVAGDPRLTSPLIERRLGDAYRAATADAHRGMTPEGCLRRLAANGSDDVLAAVAMRRA